MRRYSGVPVSPGRTLGPALIAHTVPRQAPSTDPAQLGAEEEDARLREAATAVATELERRAERASKTAADVLQATALMATDSTLLNAASTHIHTGVNAPRALWDAAATVVATLEAAGGYLADRARDVVDVRDRIIAHLMGLPAPGIPTSDAPFVLLATDLAPADTATLDPAQVLALVTAEGGPQSHTAILARALGLPAVVAADGVTDIPENTPVFVDGATGHVLTEPGSEEQDLVQVWEKNRAQLTSFSGQGRLSDGAPVPLLANIGSVEDALAAREAGAEGVGLFRTEFVFLGCSTEPSVAEQARIYCEVFDQMAGKKVVVRTLDAGADKPLPFLTDSSEPNPALGVRGYRSAYRQSEVLERQLEAIAEAASRSHAQVAVMAPMISVPEEAAAFADLCHTYQLPTSGVMIEVPAAALMAEQILEHVDFVSIGTNDLTQYTMAADRQLASLAEFTDAWQPAVLRLVHHVAALRSGKPVGVCGEAAADPALAVVLAGFGVSTLSMSARSIPAVAAVLASVGTEQARQIAATVVGAASATQARERARQELPLLGELGLG